MKASDTARFSEGIDITVIRGGKVVYRKKATLSQLLKAFQLDFCPSCGEQTTAVLIWFCQSCGERFLVRYDEKTDKSVIVPMGKERVRGI